MKYEELVKKIQYFNKEREWEQFHTPDNLAKSISIEANELLECFQWSNSDYNLAEVSEEMADVFTYLIDMASALDVDLIEITNKKVDKNAIKYPVEKAKGNSTKYNKY